MQAVHPAASLCRSKRLNGAVPDNTGPPDHIWGRHDEYDSGFGQKPDIQRFSRESGNGPQIQCGSAARFLARTC